MKRREERTGPPAASVFRESLSDREPSPSSLGEARPARLHKVDHEPHLPYEFPEAFAYGPARGTERRWGSSLVAGALSATLVASTVGLAFVGFGRTDGAPSLSTPRLDSEVQGDPVEIAAPAQQEAPGGPGPAATSAAPEEEAASAPEPSGAPAVDEPAPPAAQPPPAPVEETVEPQGGFDGQGGGSQGGGGGQFQAGGGEDEDEGDVADDDEGITDGDDDGKVDAGEPPGPPSEPEPQTLPLELPPIVPADPPEEPGVDDGDEDEGDDEPLVELPLGLPAGGAPEDEEEPEDRD